MRHSRCVPSREPPPPRRGAVLPAQGIALGKRTRSLIARANGPTLSPTNRWPVGPDLRFALAGPRGVAQGWENRGPSAQQRTSLMAEKWQSRPALIHDPVRLAAHVKAFFRRSPTSSAKRPFRSHEDGPWRVRSRMRSSPKRPKNLVDLPWGPLTFAETAVILVRFALHNLDEHNSIFEGQRFHFHFR